MPATPPAAAIVSLGLAAVLPFVLSPYHTFQLTLVIVYAIALLGLNVATGYNGQVSLGHGAFFALGGYSAAILMNRFGVPYWLALVPAAAVSFIAGLLIARPLTRLGGHYLALATFALGVATPQLLKYRLLEPWTGGVQGIVLNKPEPPPGVPLNADQWLFFFFLIVAGGVFLAVRNLLAGSVGRAFAAIRDDPVAAGALGIDLQRCKTLAFAVSVAVTGLAGALGAIAVQFVAPESYTFFLSVTLLVGVVVGGLASLSGAVFGALFIHFVPLFADEISKAAPWAIYGAVLIAVIFLFPGGVSGAVNKRKFDPGGAVRDLRSRPRA
jgi:branched-chain amino acid transport system permease protein